MTGGLHLYLTPTLAEGRFYALGFQAEIVQNFIYQNFSNQNFHTRFQDFCSFRTFQILQGKPMGREKNDFS